MGYKEELYPLHGDTMLDDETGKSLRALTVFSLCIRYMVEDMTAMYKQQVSGMDPKNIHWVLTVPAIWDDAAKQFMRHAAEEAGISGSNLSIALEPEAASIYCRQLPVHVDEQGRFSRFQTGTKYVVLDAGGGTIDITVHEICDGGHLKELYKATGGAWGGTVVDNAFLDFIETLIGKDMLMRFKEENMEDFIDFLRDFELKKRASESTRKENVTIKIPFDLIELVNSKVKSSPYNKQVTLAGDKLRMDISVFRLFFKESIDNIVMHVKDLLGNSEASGVEAILMVGGYSESPILKETIQKEFPRMNIIIPPEPSLAILTGAVIFGHCPHLIEQRVSKFIYGVKLKREFVKGRDPKEKRIKTDAGIRCDDHFHIMVQSGEPLSIDDYQFEERFPISFIYQKFVKVELYTTTIKHVKFVTDKGCKRIGSVTVPVSGRGIDRRVIIRLKFGGTELRLECEEEDTGLITSKFIDSFD
ncbi:hypothetical protein DPMN_043452 [Dreissena polymorpha]|uniref:Uncharacterized protein n=1 Tax=Dreissena polymorpha TaxID=45954 RepID=A0A9D4D117_DREPO|nr:hypothetical protein DPMN_043452 [Dreissena polymorpha]